MTSEIKLITQRRQTMKNIPKVLVKTWIQIFTKGDEREAREHAKKMIDNHFKTLQEAQDYIRK